MRGVEAYQHVKLTVTNRSVGFIYALKEFLKTKNDRIFYYNYGSF
jgi:hypothetical protein